MFIARDFDRTEHDNWELYVLPRMGRYDGATKVFSTDGIWIGWIIKPLYE